MTKKPSQRLKRVEQKKYENCYDNNKNIEGDVKITLFEDYFDKFTNERGFNRRYSSDISIPREKYEKLLEIAENYELLSEKHKEVKTRNDALLKELDDLKEDGRKFRELQEEKEKYFQSLLRVRADYENYKKISERENGKYRNYVMEKILIKLVNHYDDLVRALKVLDTLEDGKHMKKGFEMLLKNFEKLLREEGVEPMDCKGEKFDPFKHEALMVEECDDDLPENVILEELHKGFMYKDKVLRPTKVKISKKKGV